MQKSTAGKPIVRLSVASTFTCDPIEEVFGLWDSKLGISLKARFAPYDQVFQELLNRDSVLNQPENEARVVILKLDDWIRNLSDKEDSSLQSHMMANSESFCTSAALAASYTKAPLFITISRNSPDSTITPEQQAEYENYIRETLSGRSNIFVTTSEETDKAYAVEDYYDAQRDQLGHIPYKRDYFAALGTSVLRKILASRRKPYKVIVLDCDNTLWGGVCGEVGPEGIALTEPFIHLQHFMLKQVESGKILCLCSKNVEEDVDRVFAERPDMIIGKNHIVGSQINWERKSQNIKKMARELDLGLDSFIFVDDNPVECAEVRANCPEVLVLNLPARTEDFESFLNHVWPFDVLGSTKEDQLRTRLYKDNLKRADFKSSSNSLQEFIEGLNLDIRIDDVKPEEISRVSQLTFRTNQFNFTTIRRSEEELKNLLATDGFTCKICRVKDRFGDYGLVGAMMYQTLPDRIVLDSFMLSCRVLGRGVEHQMLKSVAEAAVLNGKEHVQINFRKTEKNQPALNFLTSVFGDICVHLSSPESEYKTSAASLSKLSYAPVTNELSTGGTNGRSNGAAEAPKAEGEHQSLIFEQIARDLNSASKITQRLSANGQASPVAEDDPMRVITGIWEEVLHRKGLSPDQHFFDVGGTSLKAVEVLSQLNERFNKNLTIVSLFEHSTINSLVKLVADAPSEDDQFSKVFERAASRRERFRRR